MRAGIHMKLTKLFEPTRMGTLELRNRIVMPAMSTLFANESGAVTERLINYYVERAKGGVGLIIVEATCVDSPLGKLAPIQLCIDDDKFIAGLNDLAEAVQAYGAKIAIQLHHAGRQTNVAYTEGRQPVSASDVSYLGVKPRPLTIKEIGDLVKAFAEGARRAKSAGFDALEIHGAHGYLVAQFLSPFTNKRTDRYGGDLEGRMRFPLEILGSTREKVGDDFPIIFRLSGDEYIEGGLTLEETKIIAQRLEAASVNAVHVSAGLRESRQWTSAPMCVRPGHLLHLAEGIKNVVSVPVIAVGKIQDPVFAEEILRQKRADLIAMGRALLTDPELPKKAAEGRFDDIRKCISCNRGCLMRLSEGLRISCTVNASVGKEKEYTIRLAKESKKVLVIGGGPAGMEAARVAALRGHKVTLCEKNDQLGGQLILGAIAPHKDEIKKEIDYLARQNKRLGVKIKLGKEITPSVVRNMKPDVVIVATGATPLIPKIPGVDRKNVVTAWDVLAGRVETREKVIVAGGGSVGCETAEFLAEKGKKVTIVEMLEDIAIDMEPRTRWFLLKRFAEHEIELLTNTKVEEITDKGVIIVDKELRKHTIEADTMVLALGATANRRLAERLKGEFSELYSIGDCVKPRKILDAIHEGSRIAREI